MGILRFFLHRKITQSATVALAFCLSLATPPTTTAQSLAGINGVVTDQTGAVVPNAKVTITNTATNVSRTTATTSVGTYYITDLIPGTYTVKIEASGFKSFVSNAVNVQTATVSTVNATVQTGTTTETVEVTASPISLQTEQPQVSTTIETEMPAELPTLVSGEARQIDHLMTTGEDEASEQCHGEQPDRFDGLVRRAEGRGCRFSGNLSTRHFRPPPDVPVPLRVRVRDHDPGAQGPSRPRSGRDGPMRHAALVTSR